MDLFEACENGNEERVLEIILYGSTFDRIDPSQSLRPPSSDILITKGIAGRSPLHAACIGGQMNIVRLLLGESCDVFFPSYSMEQTVAFLSPFAFIMYPHNSYNVKQLFQVRLTLHDNVLVPLATIQLPECYCIPPDTLLDAKSLDMFGNTPLQCISCFGCGCTNQHVDDGIEITKQLLYYGDQPNVPKYTNRWTPLHWSAFNGNHEQTSILLDMNAHVGSSRKPKALGKSQRSIPLLRDVDGMYPVDVAGRRAISYEKKWSCLRGKVQQQKNSADKFQLSEIEAWRSRLDPVRVIDVLANEFIENGAQWIQYAKEMGARLPHEIIRRNHHYRRHLEPVLRNGFTCIDILRYGQHLLYWTACFGMTRSVSALLQMQFKIRKRNWVKYKSANLANQIFESDIESIITVCISPLHTCSCEENKSQSVIHTAAERGEVEILRLLLDRVLANNRQTTRKRKTNAIAPHGKLDFRGANAHDQNTKRHILHALSYLKKGWLNQNRDSPLFVATMARQFDTVQLLTNTLSAVSLSWELERCNSDGLCLIQIAKDPIRSLFDHSFPSLLMDPKVEVEHKSAERSQTFYKQGNVEFILIFSFETNFKSSLMETLRESSIQSPSLLMIPLKSHAIAHFSLSTSSPSIKQYVAVGATEGVLQQHAETLQLNVKHRNSKKKSTYQRAQEAKFQPFPSLQRQQIVFDIMKIDVHVEKHLRNRNIHKLFPLHNVFGIESIFRQWVFSDASHSQRHNASLFYRMMVHSGAIYQPFSGTTARQMLLEDRTFSYDFLWPLANYFGEKHAFYYAFVVFYTVWLLFIAIPGILCQFLRTVFHIQWLEPLFAILVSVWATLVIEFWKRKRSELCIHFGSCHQNRKEQVADYYGDFEVADISLGTVDITFPRRIQLFRIYCGLPALLFMAILVVIIFLITQSGAVDKALHSWLAVIPFTGTPYIVPLCNAVCMMILDAIYTKVAIALTRWENHQTVWQRESVLATKLFWFKFLNAFLSLFWIAFVRRNATDLRNQLVIIMGIRQLWYVWERMLWPILLVRLKWRRAGFHIPLYSFLVTKWYLVDRRPKFEDNEAVPVTVYLQEAMRQPDLLLDKQMEIILQFGYVTMFVSVLPLGPLLALGINVITLRLDILSCVQAKKRPFFESECEIRTLMSILEFMSFAAVAVNCAVLFYTCHVDFDACVQLFLKGFYKVNDNVWVLRLWILLIVEHIVLGIKALLALTINDSARWVQHDQTIQIADLEASEEQDAENVRKDDSCNER